MNLHQPIFSIVFYLYSHCDQGSTICPPLQFNGRISVLFYPVSCFSKNKPFPKILKDSAGSLSAKSISADQSEFWSGRDERKNLLQQCRSVDHSWPTFPHQKEIMFFRRLIIVLPFPCYYFSKVTRFIWRQTNAQCITDLFIEFSFYCPSPERNFVLPSFHSFYSFTVSQSREWLIRV